MAGLLHWMDGMCLVFTDRWAAFSSAWVVRGCECVLFVC